MQFVLPAPWAAALVVWLCAALSGCSDERARPAHPAEPSPRQSDPDVARPAAWPPDPVPPLPAAPAPAPAARAQAAPADGEWRMAARDFAGTRFSPLDEIRSDNVASLRVAWTFATGLDPGHEAAPLVVGDTMYVVGPFPNPLFAFDLGRPGAPLRWRFDPEPAPAAQGVACCDLVNRGAAYADGLVFFNTLDGHAVAVDARTGAQRWRTRLGDVAKGETITMAPLVVKGKVLVGNSGGELGVRGWLAALDARTGREAWRAFSTGPDADVLIGPEFRPFYDADRGADLGVHTWPPQAWQIGGGTVWGWLTYDPELDLVYYGTANPGPWNADQRVGDNKWTATVFARRPDDGRAIWAYQTTPHDQHDYDGVNESVLLDLEIAGRARKVLVRPDRNGYVYVLDRGTGEVLSATAFVPVNTSHGVDLRTGRYLPNPAKGTGVGRMTRDVCPAAPGAKDWQPSAWSPRTRLLYIPHNNLCMDFQGVEVGYIAGTPYIGAHVRMYAGPGGHRGVLSAWDPVAGRAAWTVEERFPVWSGALATAGDVVFYGTMDGWFKAVDARSGALRWRFRTASGIVGQPVSYRAPDGRQHVAVLAGVGGWAGAVVSAGLDPADPTAALGFAHAMRDLPRYTRRGGVLYDFALP